MIILYRLYLQLIDLTLQKDGIDEAEVLTHINTFLEKENADVDQKVLFSQRKLEFLEDFGSDIQSVQKAYDEYQKYIKLSKESGKKKDSTKTYVDSDYQSAVVVKIYFLFQWLDRFKQEREKSTLALFPGKLVQ